MSRKNLDLIIPSGIAILMLGLVALDTNNLALRLILGVPLVVACPGYTLTAAVFPYPRLGLIETLMFTLGLSFVVATLGGLVLNVMPSGLNATTWAVLLMIVTVGGSGLALARRRTAPVQEITAWRKYITLPTILMASFITLMLVLTIQNARQDALQQPTPDFTQLWVVPASDMEPGVLRIGVQNREAKTLTYRLEVVGSTALTQEWSNIVLQPDETWETTQALPPDLPLTEPVTVRLYLKDQPDVVYRQGIYWRG